MIIRSESLLALLTEKVQNLTHDHSRHLLCPQCRIRTKLYALKDGRKKCRDCGRKFNPAKKTDMARLKRYADLLLCFCLNFTAKLASDVTGYHYRLVSGVYEDFRTLLARQNLSPGKMQLLRLVETCNRDIHDNVLCCQCSGHLKCKGRRSGDEPMFGVKILDDHRVIIEPLLVEETSLPSGVVSDALTAQLKKQLAGYTSFICKGTLHSLTENKQLRSVSAHLWAWMHEKLQPHHGIWKRNIGLYLKEFEWKYNHRLLTAETQALKIAEIMPADFLLSWGKTDKIDVDRVQNHS